MKSTKIGFEPKHDPDHKMRAWFEEYTKLAAELYLDSDAQMQERLAKRVVREMELREKGETPKRLEDISDIDTRPENEQPAPKDYEGLVGLS